MFTLTWMYHSLPCHSSFFIRFMGGDVWTTPSSSRRGIAVLGDNPLALVATEERPQGASSDMGLSIGMRVEWAIFTIEPCLNGFNWVKWWSNEPCLAQLRFLNFDFFGKSYRIRKLNIKHGWSWMDCGSFVCKPLQKTSARNGDMHGSQHRCVRGKERYIIMMIDVIGCLHDMRFCVKYVCCDTSQPNALVCPR